MVESVKRYLEVEGMRIQIIDETCQAVGREGKTDGRENRLEEERASLMKKDKKLKEELAPRNHVETVKISGQGLSQNIPNLGNILFPP